MDTRARRALEVRKLDDDHRRISRTVTGLVGRGDDAQRLAARIHAEVEHAAHNQTAIVSGHIKILSPLLFSIVYSHGGG